MMMLKSKYIYITLFMLFQHSLFYSQLSALDFDKHQGYWSVGVQYGNAYQWSDVDSKHDGWGTSLSLAKNLYFDDYAFLSLDLRSRLFLGISKGLNGAADVNISENEAVNGWNNTELNYAEFPGFIFHNYKNSFFGIDLEPNILLNKYREETGWYMNLFGGAGVGVYNTRMDLRDDAGTYATRFDLLDQNMSEKSIKDELNTILDGKYESRADGFYKNQLKVGIMPSVGMEIGFDITRYLTAYLGHRTIFTRSDLFDGQQLKDPDNDILNFTHFGLQVHFSNRESKRKRYSAPSSSEINTETEEYRVYDENPEHGYPIVKISYPEVDWFNTSNGEMEVIASLENVYSVLDISCMVNGKEVAFDYEKDQVRFYAYFQRGTNVLKVQVRNEKGEARDIKRVIFTPVSGEYDADDEVLGKVPIIELISPETTDFYADEDVVEIKAYIENVEVKDDIKLSANGMELTTFRFDPDLGIVSIKVRLAKGTNKFMLTGYNSKGKTEQEFRIYYGVDPESEIVVTEEEDEHDDQVNSEQDNDDSEYPPIESNTKPYISLISPSSNPFYTRDESVFVRFETHGIDSKDDLTFTVNGRKNVFFDFDRNNKVVSDEIQLMELETVISLSGSNQYGTTEKSLIIKFGDAPEDYNEPAQEKQRIIENVDVSKPDEDCYSEFLVSFNENVRKEDIHITMNDFKLRNFRYVEEDRKLRFSLYLDEGENDINIAIESGDKSENARVNLNCGDDSEDEIMIEEEEVIDTSPANISNLEPEDQLITESKDIILRFNALHINKKEDILIFLNDELVDEFEYSSFDGKVQAMLTLWPKENELIIRVSNDYGRDERTLMYFYDEPFTTKPSVVINSPRNGFSTDETSLIFRASVDFIKSISKVQVYLNDKPFTDFNYNEEYGKIQAVIPLRLGKNTLRVTAENKLGTSSETVSFSYRLAYVPSVEILGPKEGLEYRKSFAMLTGIAQNMKDKRGIGIQINGKPFKALSFDEKTEMVSSRLLLEKGNNEIILSAKNEYGFASDTINIFFKGAPEKPAITFLNPSKEGTTSQSQVFSLEAEVLEINHSINVELTVNGRNIEEVYYFKDEKLVKAEFNLKKGRNDIKLVARNDTGVTTARTNIYLP